MESDAAFLLQNAKEASYLHQHDALGRKVLSDLALQVSPRAEEAALLASSQQATQSAVPSPSDSFLSQARASVRAKMAKCVVV